MVPSMCKLTQRSSHSRLWRSASRSELARVRKQPPGCRQPGAALEVEGGLKFKGAFEQLVDWIEFHDGHVHKALELVDDAPCGTRGIISVQNLSVEQLGNSPLIVIPEKLHLTPDAAQTRLTPRLKPLGLPSVERWLEDYQIALLLAYERSQGRSSLWYPYIETLPQEPPSGWYLGAAQLQHLDHPARLPPSWPPRLEQVKNYALDELEEMADFYCEPLNISLPGLMWALAQVHSRAVDDRQALVPAIDLLNHAETAAAPVKVTMPGSSERYMGVYSTHKAVRQPLTEGGELYINYHVEDPFDCFVHYGWLPRELEPVRLL